MFKQFVYLIPNVLTLTSLFLGFSSILFSVQAVNDLYLSALRTETAVDAYPENFLALAGLFILLAAIFDFLDGFSARFFKASTPMGKQLDSLADFLSFGVAPAVLFFTITLIATEYVPATGIEYILPLGIGGAWLRENLIVCKLLAFILPGCTMLRLAKFNLLNEHRPYFEGLPSTYAGAFLGVILTFNFYITPLGSTIAGTMTIPLFVLEFVQFFAELFSNYLFLMSSYLILAFLMISPLRFYKLDVILANQRWRQYLIPTLMVAIVLSALFFKYVYILAGVGYIVGSAIYSLINRRQLVGP